MVHDRDQDSSDNESEIHLNYCVSEIARQAMNYEKQIDDQVGDE